MLVECSGNDMLLLSYAKLYYYYYYYYYYHYHYYYHFMALCVRDYPGEPVRGR